MAMIAGSVTVDDDGNVVKSGAAEAVYDVLVADAALDFAPDPLPSGPDGAKILKGLARMANTIAALIPYIQANAQLKVFATDSGLQKSTSVGVLTAQPDADATFGAIL